MGFAPISQRRLSDDIVSQLEALILEGSLKTGERLPAERALAERFGVSRPSLREAIQKLVAKGLLVSRQGGGNYVAQSMGSTFSDPLLQLLENNPEVERDLLEFRQTLEASCAYYAALRATAVDRERLKVAFDALQDCYARADEVSRAEEGAADASFHLAIAEASHNAVLLHTIRGLFDLLKRNVVTNIGGMYKQRSETRDMLIDQHRELYLQDGDKGHYWDSTVVGGPGPVPTLLLTTVGRKTGQKRIMPLIYGKVDEGYVIVASKGGAPQHPDWYGNLEAQPAVEVQVAKDCFSARAETVTGAKRQQFWEMMLPIWPPYAQYQTKTEREIPVVLLRPV